MYIDSHAHLTSSKTFPHIEELLERAKDLGVEKIVNICTDKESLEKGISLSKRHPWIFNTAATTPHDVAQDGSLFFPLVEAKVSRLIALGETGLDYHYEHSSKEMQKNFLIRYFDLAKKVSLPLIFHCREAFSDLFSLSDIHYKSGRAVLHCFTGTLSEAKGCLDRGWLISFSGIITFKKSELLREVVGYVPLEQMLIETDTPYLAPESKRGQPNEPSYIGETAAVIASIKKVELAKAAQITAQNAQRFFSFPKAN